MLCVSPAVRTRVGHLQFLPTHDKIDLPSFPKVYFVNGEIQFKIRQLVGALFDGDSKFKGCSLYG